MSGRKTDDWIKTYMKYTENTEPPTLYREWTAISCLGAVLERKCYINWGHFTLYPNMYIVLVGPSGKCRKGTAMGTGKDLLKTVGINLSADAITREALIREMKRASQTQADPQTGDMIFHSSLTVYSPELTVFLGYNNVKLMADLCDWFDCPADWEYRTKGSGTDEITGVYMNIIGATTPELIRSTLPDDAIGGGLSSRIVFVCAEKKGKVVPRPFLTEQEQDIREDLISDLDAIHMMKGEFQITEEFIDAYDKWYRMQEENPPLGDPKFAGYNSRRQVHLIKLCMIISASRSDDMMLTEEILIDALGLLKVTEKKMPLVYQGYGTADNAQVMQSVMQSIQMNGTLTRKELMRQHYSDLGTIDKLDEIIQALSFSGFISYDFETGKIKHQK